MKRNNIIAVVLLLLILPIFVMAYIPLVDQVRRNVAKHAGNEIRGRLEWHVREYKKVAATLSNAAVPPEDQGPDVHYFTFGKADSTRFILTVSYGPSDSVSFDSAIGEWR